MSALTEQPKGLIGLFGLRDMGAVPRELSPQIVATLDITQFVLTNRDAVNLGTFGVTAPGLYTPAGGSISATVPAGELWYVHQFSVAAVTALAVGDTMRFRTCLVDSTLYFPRGPSVSGAAGENPITLSDRMFLATPGQSLRCWVEQHAGAAVTLTAYALITRIKI